VAGFEANPWLLTRRAAPRGQIRLLCLPHAGAGASMFMSWASRLPQEIEVRGLQLPGHENRHASAPFPRIEDLIGAMISELAPALDPPYALLGCSLGALIAYELAQRLASLRMPGPEYLFAASSAAPHRLTDLPDTSAMGNAALLEYASRRYGAVSPEMVSDPELVAAFVPTLRADLEMMATYVFRARPPLDCPLHVFIGSEDATIKQSAAADWQELTSSAFRLSELPGGHFFMRQQPDQLLEAIAGDLKPRLAAG
jgi:surfactin synthase thioesterase subunit